MAEPKNILAEDVLKGCTKRWLDVLVKDDMLEQLQTTLDAIAHTRFAPPARDMFSFARYSLGDVKVVIIGMDPYPKAGQAHGLSFSTLDDACPASLQRILKVWEREKLIEYVPGVSKAVPHPYDLSYLSKQGFIWLNCALTVEIGAPGSQIKTWQPYMDRVISRLSAALGDKVMWCLWGKDAQAKAPLIRSGKILRWCHPVAMERPSFSECDHFRKIADLYPDLVWDPRKTETHFYTDGAGKNNQSKDCYASWGVVCRRGLMAGRSWSGQTVLKTIVGPIPKRTKKTGEIRKYKELGGGLAEVEARPTNIRAEGEALIRALELALSLTPYKSIIHSDSKFWIDDMLQGYIPDWVERGVKFTSKANSDLLERIWPLWQRASAAGTRFQFVNAWHDRDRPEGGDDLEWWLGNRAAEEAAESAL